MRPVETSLYKPDHSGTYRIVFSYFFCGPGVFPYCKNLLVGKFRHAMCFAQWVNTHTNVIRNILFSRSPVKIIGAVIAFIAITMTHFVLRWTRAIKYQSHQAMNIRIPFASFFAKLNRVVSGRANIRQDYFLWRDPLAIAKRHYAREASNLPFIRDLVKPFVFWYRFPSFHK